MESQFPVFEGAQEANPKPIKNKRRPPPLENCDRITAIQLNPPEPSQDIQTPLAFLLGFITIGCIEIAKKFDKLKDEKITNVLNCYQNGRDAEEYPRDISRLCCPFLDNADANLMEQLPEAFAFIEETKQKNGKILVHCFAGISRSVSIVMAYLIWKEHEKYNELSDVYYEVVTIRRKANPNLSFCGQLYVFLEMKKLNLCLC